MTGRGRRTREQAERIVVARLGATAHRYGRGDGDPGADPVAVLREISTDRQLLGRAAGTYLLRAAGGDRHAAAALQLLRSAGADEQAIQAGAEQVRRRLAVPDWHREVYRSDEL